MTSSDMLQLYFANRSKVAIVLGVCLFAFPSIDHSVKSKTSDLASRQNAITTRKKSPCVL